MERVLLVDIESVERAASTMQRAAEQIQSAALTLDAALSQHAGRMETMLHDFVSALESLLEEKEVFMCAYCEREFSDRAQLRQHTTDKHGKVRL